MGRIEVITGPMYAGKTEELIRRIKRTVYTKQRCVAFKHSFDNRYSKNDIVTHDGQKIECISVCDSSRLKEQLASLKEEPEVVAVDEGQFFDQGIVEVVCNLANKGKRVIVAGLDMDYAGAPFGQMPQLLAVADSVTKLKAVCAVCAGDAMFSKRIVDQEGTVLVGAKNEYVAVCRRHFN